MAAKLSPISIRFPPDLAQMIQKDATLNERSFSGQVVWAVRAHYMTRKMEAELFTPTELDGSEPRKIPVFRTKDELDASAPVKPQKHLGQESS